MKIPDLAAFCAKPAPAADGHCVRFPGGAKFCLPNFGAGSPMEQLRAALMLVSVLLIPLQPFFNVLGVIKAIKEAIEAVPGLLTDPSKLLQKIVDLLKAFAKLVALFPQLSVPIMVKDILALAAFALRTLAAEMQAFIDAGQRLSEAAALASSLNLDALTVEVSCAQDGFDIEFANQNAALGPLGQLLEAVSLLLELAGQKPLAIDLTGAEDPATFVQTLNDIANALDAAASAIPL